MQSFFTPRRIGAFVLSILALGAAAHAQPVDCACDATYEVGDRVIALYDNPGGATGLPIGSRGTIVCGISPPLFGNDILVRWDNWSNGSIFYADNCDCPVSSGGSGTGTTSDSYVSCEEIGFPPEIMNVTQGTMHETLQGAVDAAFDGDMIEIGAGTLYEDGIVIPFNRSVTITGAGHDLTIIDGLGDASPTAPILTILDHIGMPEIRGLTLRNGFETEPYSAGGALVENSAAHFVDVNFESNGRTDVGAAGGSHLFGVTATAIFDRCTFLDAEGPASGIMLFDSTFSFHTCLFARLEGTRMVLGSDSSISLVNCTVADGHVEAFDTSTINFANSTATWNIAIPSGTTLNASRSLFPNASLFSGDNIEGMPTFVDAANGDYRLAPGSLGIDAADINAYLAGGGGQVDLAGEFRYADDIGTPNTGTGAFQALDIGALEFQGASPATDCPGDANHDNIVDFDDLNILLGNWGLLCD